METTTKTQVHKNDLKESKGTARIRLYKPHKAQKELHGCSSRFRIVASGRRFGKTLACVNELLKFSWEHPASLCWWISPTYSQSRIAFRLAVKGIPGVILKSTQNPMEIVLHNGSIIQFNSTDQPDNLRGQGVHFMVVDEAAHINDDVWDNVLRATLSDTEGKAIIISTPRGIGNWFHRLWCMGDDQYNDYKDYTSFTFPTSANPYISRAELEEVERTLPKDIFRQEYLAEFLEDGGSVFSGVSYCIAGELEEPIPEREYILGVDLAKHTDWTFIVVLDVLKNHVVHTARFNRIDYSIQVLRIQEVSRRYNKARIIMDSTGVGDPILEQVKMTGLSVDGFQFTNKSKQQLIEHLAVQIEQKQVTFPDIRILINELLSYQYELTRAGNISYSAPGSLHDDAVIALALAVWAARHQMNPRVIIL